MPLANCTSWFSYPCYTKSSNNFSNNFWSSRNEIAAGFKLDCVEWVVELDAECDVIRNAIDILFSYLRARAAEGEYPLTFWMEMRVMATSDVCLSPAVVSK